MHTVYKRKFGRFNIVFKSATFVSFTYITEMKYLTLKYFALSLSFYYIDFKNVHVV